MVVRREDKRRVAEVLLLCWRVVETPSRRQEAGPPTDDDTGIDIDIAGQRRKARLVNA